MMTATTEYRKKPVVVEAIQYDGSTDRATEIIDWALSNGGTIRFHCDDGEACRRDSHVLHVSTLEGRMTALPGDWIIRGVQGEFYPCKPDIFAATYEPVEAATAAQLVQAPSDTCDARTTVAGDPWRGCELPAGHDGRHIYGKRLYGAYPEYGIAAPSDTDRTPEFEAVEQELFKHQPVMSMHDGGIAGCQCMDRVFHSRTEDWGTHLAEVFESLGFSRTSQPVRVEVAEPMLVQYNARRNGKTEAMIERLLSRANEHGIRVEVVYPQVEVTTVEELDALPVGSVVMEIAAEPFLGIPTVEGVFHKFPVAVQEPGRTPDEGWREWFVVAGHGARPASEIILPARVLYRPAAVTPESGEKR